MKNNILSLIIALLMSSGLIAQCDYTLELYDSFGDGWDGTTLSVTVAGVPAVGSPFTFTSGDFADFTISGVNPGDAICVTFGGGSFLTEKEFGLIDANGNYVMSVPSPIDGSVTCVTATCPDPVEPCISLPLVLNDSFGDAWNGATLSISAAGEFYQYTIFNGRTTPNESVANYMVCLPASVCDVADGISVEFFGGTFDEEITYDFDDGGCAAGPTPATGVVCSIDGPPCVVGVPTLGQWGLTLLGLFFLAFGSAFAFMKRKVGAVETK